MGSQRYCLMISLGCLNIGISAGFETSNYENSSDKIIRGIKNCTSKSIPFYE